VLQADHQPARTQAPGDCAQRRRRIGVEDQDEATHDRVEWPLNREILRVPGDEA
jgi:hypothetical protein